MAGGYRDEESRFEVNIYSIDRGTWTEGPALPMGIFSGQVVDNGTGGFYIVGGAYDFYNFLNMVYEFDPINMVWIERDESLVQGRDRFATIDVDKAKFCTLNDAKNDN